MNNLHTFKANIKANLAILKQEVAQLQSNISECEKTLNCVTTTEELDEFLDNFDLEKGLSRIQLF